MDQRSSSQRSTVRVDQDQEEHETAQPREFSELDASRRGSTAKPDDIEITPLNNETRELQSGTTIVEKQSPADIEKPRRRFVPGFMHRKAESRAEEEQERPKKRPWYKGKELHHSEPFTVRNQLGATIFNSWVNVLLIAAPVGIALNYVGVDGKAVFVVNFIAIIPLAGLLSFATEEIALHVGESLGGLLNASFGYVS